jgi:tetratricopeptide (TPR) repeat protein
MSVTVFAGTLARDCARAALQGHDDADSFKLCDLALTTEVLSRHDRAVTYMNRGCLFLSRNDLRNARRDFDAAIAIEDTLAEAYINRGAADIADRRYAEGLAETERGLDLGPREPEKAYYNRAIAHEHLGNVRQAYLDYQKAAELRPGWDLPAKELGRFSVRKAGE